jgi:anti-anti-sigma factor
MAQIVTFAGEYDMPCKSALRRDMNDAADEDVVVLDFSAVTYIDSTCLTELALLSRSRKEAGREPATLVLPDGTVKRILSIAHIDSLFRTFPSLGEAMANRSEPFTHRAATPGGPYLEMGDDY